MSASGSTMLTTHLKIWIIAFHVQNSSKLRKSKSVLEFATPLKKRFVPIITLGPADVCNLLFRDFLEEK